MQSDELQEEKDQAVPQPLGNDPLVGTILGDRYELLERIGDGGMGIIYKARHTATESIVAIKIIHRTLIYDMKMVARFHQEAKILAALQHPNIIGVKRIDADSGLCYLVMEYVEGTSLSQIIKQRGKLHPAQWKNLFTQAAAALAHAHSKGIIHRDLKPSNLMIVKVQTGQELIKILDFGVSKLLGANDQLTTDNGICLGSPYYMSPEQCKGGKADQRSDIYSLGCVMYEALMGKPPFEGANAMEIAEKHISEALPPHGNKALKPLMRVVGKCTTKDPKERYQNMEEVLVALQEGENKSLKYTAIPVRKTKVGRAQLLALSVVTLAVVCLTGFYMWHQSQQSQQTALDTPTPASLPGVALDRFCNELQANQMPSREEAKRVETLLLEPLDERYLKKKVLLALGVYSDRQGDQRARNNYLLDAIAMMHKWHQATPVTAQLLASYLKRDGDEAGAMKVLQHELEYAQKLGQLGDVQDLQQMISTLHSATFQAPQLH